MSKNTHLLPYARRADFHVGRAPELSGRDRIFYSFLEMIPGLASWSTLIAVVLASIYAPFLAAYFIIAFAVYWVLKTAFLSYHLRHNWKRLRHHMAIDWEKQIERFEYGHLYQLVIFPFYTEPESVIDSTLSSLAQSKYDTKSMIIVLASEKRAGPDAEAYCRSDASKVGK